MGCFHFQEMTLMKQVIMNMAGGKSVDVKRPSSARERGSKSHLFDVPEPHTDKPGPTQFVSIVHMCQ